MNNRQGPTPVMGWPQTPRGWRLKRIMLGWGTRLHALHQGLPTPSTFTYAQLVEEYQAAQRKYKIYRGFWHDGSKR